MPDYPFAALAERTLGLSFFIDRHDGNKLKAQRFQRNKVAGITPISWTPMMNETAQVVTNDFGFSLGVGDQQTGLLAIEVMGWTPWNYRATQLHLLGYQSPFTSNGAEILEPLSNSANPDGRKSSATTVAFNLVRGPLSHRVNWNTVGSSGSVTLDADNPGLVFSLRLVQANTGQLKFDPNSPWGAAQYSTP